MVLKVSLFAATPAGSRVTFPALPPKTASLIRPVAGQVALENAFHQSAVEFHDAVAALGTGGDGVRAVPLEDGERGGAGFGGVGADPAGVLGGDAIEDRHASGEAGIDEAGGGGRADLDKAAAGGGGAFDAVAGGTG